MSRKWSGPRVALAGLALMVGGSWHDALGVEPAGDVAHGRALYGLCATCHGAEGAGDASRGAPPLAGLEPWYVETQLHKFRKGWRGYHPDDVRGLQMRPMAAALASDQDVRDVVAFVATLPRTAQPKTLEGDAARGQPLFAPCAACHGPAGEGNRALNAPALAGQADWYLARQVQSFQHGLRGTHPEDVTGAQMRAMAATVSGDQALADLAVYIAALAR